MKVTGTIAQHIQEIFRCIQGGQGWCKDEGQVYVALLDHWAVLKDYELKHQLLKNLVLRYATIERNLAELNSKLVELNQLKNRFLGFAAHDLRNPLSSIRGLSEIMLTEMTGPLTEEQREFLSTIYAASRDMLALVNDLLDISVIESGRLDLKIQQDSMKTLIRERLRIFKLAAESKGIQFSTDFEDLPEVPFDRNRIAQVIDNLVGNAVKLAPAESTIEVRLWQQAGFAKVSVEDEGPGIAAEDQPLIFGEFQRIGGQNPSGEKGTGLGLAIAKRIIEAHRGYLEVRSTLGVGSTFSFAIPAEVEHGASQEAQGDYCRG
jgi:two-component system, sensor histidine kinase and response regulator